MGADATLVAAAYRMGMANVPGDWSDSFNKMYEGIAAGHIAKAKMFSDTFEAGIDAYADMKVRGAEGDEKATDMSTLKTLVYGDETTIAMNKLAEDNTKQKLGKNANHYSQGGGMHKDVFDAALSQMTGFKDNLEKIQNKLFPTRKDKENRDSWRRAADQLKMKGIEIKAGARTLIDANNSGQINWEVTRKNWGEHATEYQELQGQIMDKDSNFKELGIKAFFGNGEADQMGDGKTYDKNELYYQYTPGRLGASYFSNQKKKGNLVEIDPNTGQPKMGPKTFTESLVIQDDKGGVINIPPEPQVVSHKTLMNVSLYDRETEAANMAEIAKAPGYASQMMADKKTYQHTSFRDKNVPFDLASQVHANFVNNIKNSKVGAASTIQDLSSRDIRGQSYAKNLMMNPEITNATYESMGIPIEEIIKYDKNSDGKIGKNEYKNFAEKTITPELQAQIINKLTNPSTDEDIAIATTEMANWWTNQAEVIFNIDRGKLNEAKRRQTKTQTRTTRGTQTERDRNRKYNTLSDKISGGETFQLGGKNSAYQIDPQNGVILKKFINQAGEEETQQVDPQIFLDEYFGAGMYESGEVFSDTAFTQSPIGDETEEANEDFKNRGKEKKKGGKKKGSVAGLNWLQRKMFGM